MLVELSTSKDNNSERPYSLAVAINNYILATVVANNPITTQEVFHLAAGNENQPHQDQHQNQPQEHQVNNYIQLILSFGERNPLHMGYVITILHLIKKVVRKNIALQNEGQKSIKLLPISTKPTSYTIFDRKAA
jgi:hypothetical protein